MTELCILYTEGVLLFESRLDWCMYFQLLPHNVYDYRKAVVMIIAKVSLN